MSDGQDEHEILETDDRWDARCPCDNASLNLELAVDLGHHQFECGGCGRTIRPVLLVENDPKPPFQRER